VPWNQYQDRQPCFVADKMAGQLLKSDPLGCVRSRSNSAASALTSMTSAFQPMSNASLASLRDGGPFRQRFRLREPRVTFRLGKRRGRGGVEHQAEATERLPRRVRYDALHDACAPAVIGEVSQAATRRRGKRGHGDA